MLEEMKSSQRPMFVRRWLDVVSSVVPKVILVLLAKGPVCVAAHIAMGTGIGLSLPVAADWQTLPVILYVTSLTYFVARQIRRCFAPE
jgi:hypothetical protein